MYKVRLPKSEYQNLYVELLSVALVTTPSHPQPHLVVVSPLHRSGAQQAW